MDDPREPATIHAIRTHRPRDAGPVPRRWARHAVAVGSIADDPHRAIVTERLVVFEHLAPVA